MAPATRRQFLQLIAISGGLAALGSIAGCSAGAPAPTATPTTAPAQPTTPPQSAGGQKLDSLIVKGSPGPLTIPIAHATQSDSLKALVNSVEFGVWKTPDQLRSDITSNRLQIAVATSNVPANLYRRGIPVKLFSVTTVEGMFSIMSTDPKMQGWADLKGRKFALAYKDDMPDLLFRYVAKANGLDTQKDMQVQYTSTPTETMQMLIAGKVDTAFVAEPLGTAAEVKAKQSGVEVRRVLDLGQEWGKVTSGPARIPMAGTIAVESIARDNPKIVLAMQAALTEATVWTNNNHADAAKLGAEKLGLEAPVMEKSLGRLKLEAIPAAEARTELEAFFSRLMELSAEIVGGGLPDDGFYFKAQ